MGPSLFISIVLIQQLAVCVKLRSLNIEPPQGYTLQPLLESLWRRPGQLPADSRPVVRQESGTQAASEVQMVGSTQGVPALRLPALKHLDLFVLSGLAGSGSAKLHGAPPAMTQLRSLSWVLLVDAQPYASAQLLGGA
jgi:hypothetical protein